MDTTTDMKTALTDQYDGNITNIELVQQAIDGQGDKLEALVRRHHGWITNDLNNSRAW